MLEHRPLEENRRLQWKALVQILQHAYESCPFYRRRFDEAGVRPSENLSPAELQKIPPLTREDIRTHQSDLWSRRYRLEELAQAATGGTTDTPIPLLRNREMWREKVPIQLRFDSWAGLLPGDKVFHLWGARIDYAENPGWRWRFFVRYVRRQVWAPTSLLNEQVLESYRQELNRFRPRVIYAYPTPLAIFCEYLRDCKRPYRRPVSAICTAEPLLAHQRQLIEDVLGCPVFEHYGTREFGLIAAECEIHQGMHLNPAAAYVEFVPVAGAEAEGLHEILVTDLLNYGMPLIRYRINDCARLGQPRCPCRREYPLIREIVGRTTDVFQLSNGDKVPGVALTNRVLQVCPGLKKVQVIQESVKDFRVRYVPGPAFTQADLDLLQTNLRNFFPNQLRWGFEQVKDIEREPSGKTRFCISRVDSLPIGRGAELSKASQRNAEGRAP
jgi:phenylacetate-CoA ligase